MTPSSILDPVNGVKEKTGAIVYRERKQNWNEMKRRRVERSRLGDLTGMAVDWGEFVIPCADVE